MTIDEQIKIIQGLIDGVIELNGEYQSGWDDEIQSGSELLKYLEKLLEESLNK